MQLDLNALITGKILLDNGGGGGGSGITKIAEKEFTVSTTSTTETALGYVPVDWDGDGIILVTILDNEGNRASHHYGTLSAFVNPSAKNGSTVDLTAIPVCSVYSNENSKYAGISTKYGVYAGQWKWGTDKGIRIYSKYNSSNSLTIDGTFKVTVYKLDIPFLA